MDQGSTEMMNAALEINIFCRYLQVPKVPPHTLVLTGCEYALCDPFLQCL